jgi:quercetin dioxygenase-like cupin family protein
MQIIDFPRDHARPIDLFDAVAASNVRLAGGRGEAHVYCLYFDAGGSIGAHPAGFAQLFLVVEGHGWVAGEDGAQTPIRAGQGAYFAPGEIHSKGSDAGMTVIMVQADDLEPAQ